MNYLAHIVLSGDQPALLFGNFIGDIIKFKNVEHLDQEVQKGIQLHRYIDRITDAHTATRATIDLFREKHGLYSSVIVDIAFDHFLFRNWDKYSELTYDEFCEQKYPILLAYFDKYTDILPPFIQSMINTKWLNIYTSYDGLGRVYQSMKRRVSKPHYFDHCISTIEANEEEIEEHFNELFSYLLERTANKRESLIPQSGRKA